MNMKTTLITSRSKKRNNNDEGRGRKVVPLQPDEGYSYMQSVESTLGSTAVATSSSSQKSTPTQTKNSQDIHVYALGSDGSDKARMRELLYPPGLAQDDDALWLRDARSDVEDDTYKNDFGGRDRILVQDDQGPEASQGYPREHLEVQDPSTTSPPMHTVSIPSPDARRLGDNHGSGQAGLCLRPSTPEIVLPTQDNTDDPYDFEEIPVADETAGTSAFQAVTLKSSVLARHNNSGSSPNNSKPPTILNIEERNKTGIHLWKYVLALFVLALIGVSCCNS